MKGEEQQLRSIVRAAVEEALDSRLEELREELAVAIEQGIDAQLTARTEIEPLLSVRDVASALKVSVRTVEELMIHTDLKPIWIGRQRLFHPDQVQAYINSPKRRAKTW